MTMQEAGERYGIPLEILREYEGWGLCGSVKQAMGAWRYDERDLERLGMIMTLHDIGFCAEEVEAYMRLMLEGEATAEARLRMLNRRRCCALDEIHLKEKQLARLDYLRHSMRAQSNSKEEKA
ncbi:MAG: MerR family transcriptional regulator [Clostridia bacterium]|nr:MerR family transcriptional regulator [Clostridia bacterium]